MHVSGISHSMYMDEDLRWLDSKTDDYDSQEPNAKTHGQWKQQR